MSSSSKTFRIFVSSTFSDLKAERNALQQYVFPRVRDLCMQHGCRFQAIDLRWGVSEEAGRGQQTVPICLKEIERCQRVTPRPNFIILLGNRYGWRPLPTDADADGLPDEWEYSIVDAIVTDSVDHIADVELGDDFDGDGVSNADEYAADTRPTNKWSYLHFTGISTSNWVVGLRWSGGILATQYVDRCTSLEATGGSCQCWYTNLPPTASVGVLADIDTSSTPNVFFRIRACR